MVGRISAALGAMAVAAPLAASRQPAAGAAASRTGAVDFLEHLKQAVDAADRRTVAAMVAYPLTVLASGFNIPVKDAPTFLRMYDSLLTPELRCAVVESAIPAGTAPAPRHPGVITPDGLSLVEGAIWAPLKNGRYRIARIRVLPAAPSVEGRKGIERVTFTAPKGERSASFAGWLVRQNVDAYVVAMKKGETLHARIDGFRGHDATLRVSTPMAGTAHRTSQVPPDIGRTASATASADGDLHIEVANLARYCDPPQRYKLTVTVR
jgi:hypothetical protein